MTFSTHTTHQLFPRIFIIFLYKAIFIWYNIQTKVHSGVEIQSAAYILSVSVKLDIESETYFVISSSKISDRYIWFMVKEERTLSLIWMYVHKRWWSYMKLYCYMYIPVINMACVGLYVKLMDRRTNCRGKSPETWTRTRLLATYRICCGISVVQPRQTIIAVIKKIQKVNEMVKLDWHVR